MPIDVLVVGAGPAGAVAATVLARAGVNVLIVDRETFPRPKLCGDTVNPGTLAALRTLGLSGRIEAQGLAVDGMVVTGESGVTIRGRYPDGLVGRALRRSDLDWILLSQAMQAGAQFEPGVNVRRAIVDESRPHGSAGVVTGVRTTNGAIHAPVVVAADGRRSTIAFGLKLAGHPTRPRRWAIGAYFENASGTTSMGEMHVRRRRYIGVAPVPGGLTNVCVVVEQGHWRQSPADLLKDALSRERMLRDRFAAARVVQPPAVLGPLAIDAARTSIDGLLLAGDAAGFIDPMTGDGLRFAVRGGELAAAAALEALAHGWMGVHSRQEAARRRSFASKWRFNRALRSLVASPGAIRLAGFGARLAPGMVERIVARAGDCDLAGEALDQVQGERRVDHRVRIRSTP